MPQRVGADAALPARRRAAPGVALGSGVGAAVMAGGATAVGVAGAVIGDLEGEEAMQRGERLGVRA